MSVEELEKAVSKLAPDELARFRAWFDAFDADKWDRRIASDVKSGKWDALADEAIADHKRGQTRKIIGG